MGAPAEVVERLDEARPFWDERAAPIFSDDAIAALATVDGVERRLLDVALDEAESLERRFAAVEALFQGGWTSWRDGAEAARVAAVMAQAVPADRIHNRWGIPGHVVGRTGRDLLSIPAGVEEALESLLDDRTPLAIEGSEAATVAENKTVADLAAYLLAERRGA